MIKQFKDWITEQEHQNILAEVCYVPKWRFGQTSDDTIKPSYPMWFQGFYDLRNHKYIDNCPQVVKDLGERFMDIMPEDYVMVRCMASSNTFGQDGDVHTDWLYPDVSQTGVLYTDKIWDRNWGGDTVFYNGDETAVSEYKPRKLVTFDASIEHIGKGPQRRCPEMRSILAFQAVHIEAYKKRFKG